MNGGGGRRVAVVGSSCAGKSTLSRSLASALGVPHVELDTLFWGPEWTPQPLEEFRRRVAGAAEGPTWVIDGNYSRVRDLVWPRATTLVWLDLPFRVVFPRAVSRTVRRYVTQEPLFAGNRERFHCLDPDWIPWWVLRTFRRRRQEITVLLREPRHAHLEVHRLRSDREVAAFLASR